MRDSYDASEENSQAHDGLVGWGAKTQFRAGIQLGLGVAQMFMAVFSVALLMETGLSRFTLGSTAFTTLLTLISRRLFHGENRK